MARKAKLLLILGSSIAVFMIAGFVLKNQVQTRVKELFSMNKALQEEGYYMGDFEFKMLGFGYYLDKGQYIKALTGLADFHAKLSKRDGLIKPPEFRNNQEEIDFYLNLQNSKTGAFIDESAPYCTYWEVSQNIINHMEALVDSTTAPLKLKYPLKFLDEINTPEKLTAFLDDISYVGWIASKFPQTSFHFARNMLGGADPDGTLERNNLYTFSSEWKHTMLKWMYDFQDSTTGLWGPKNWKTKKLMIFDLNNTASILNAFRDNDGNDRYKEFPLKYQDKLFKSAIEQLSDPYPNEDDLPEIHEWNLRQGKGIKMLLRHLWKDASNENKKSTESITIRYINICFEKYYVKTDGAFSYYPNAKHASLDGNFDIFSDIGALSYKKQNKLWGDHKKNVRDMGTVSITDDGNFAMDFLDTLANINSLRIYNSRPNFSNLTDSVWAVIYPKPTIVLDVMEIVPNIIAWTETSTLSMGNWTSMVDIQNQYALLNIKKPLVFKDVFPYNEVIGLLKKSSEIYIVGYDVLQIPRFVIAFQRH